MVATFSSARMEASRCRLGPRGDRSERHGGWSRLERGGGPRGDSGGALWELKEREVGSGSRD